MMLSISALSICYYPMLLKNNILCLTSILQLYWQCPRFCWHTGLLHSFFLPPAAKRRGRGARTPRAPAKGCALCTPALPDDATDLLVCYYLNGFRDNVILSSIY